ncbi:MAG: DJ-1/PfpI family protein [Alphaproteobacteria bacterium]|jgi:putative intracellular protease/amidase|nr:DJ-1/PfpI family protein [Alphaproteobacteria bacterium]
MAKTLGALIFPGYELLDMFGPLEMFGMMGEEVEIRMVAQTSDPVASRQGPQTVVDDAFGDRDSYDMLLIPGGPGTRPEVDNPVLIDWIKAMTPKAALTMTVCTGSALLARTGLIDGKRATSNKAAFKWVMEQGPKVDWIKQARWCEDGAIMTSSGVSAGMDMALAAIAREYSAADAERVANSTEYDWKQDPDWDPFAKIHGLV